MLLSSAKRNEKWFCVETFRKCSKSKADHFVQVSKNIYFSVSLCRRPQHGIVEILGNFERHDFTLGKKRHRASSTRNVEESLLS